ncbi:hypothetical protein GO755_25395 [Spirosoma sp. HMF4905]|uniref:SRPBCC domain-containing protein n=1 Tax=Spirosoma arboris TaxID=2682092 RepID=A0A7K1SHV9_9BACT|nr:hypothetical protein [Spirosoma arboris]MVM33399.1 hypothetical protein [Spirosoma arboris]
MKQQSVIDQLSQEVKLLQGEATKDVTYSSQQTFPDEVTTSAAFNRSIEKLWNVAAWSNLSPFTATFKLFDSAGQPKVGCVPQQDDYIQVIIPGPAPENWVQVTHTYSGEKWAEFTVRPSHDPHKPPSAQIDHFFHAEARSTFRVERTGTTITAYEIGRYEGINRDSPQAGHRGLVNTVMAEVGWLFYQKLQWKHLTDYLVHVES